jgi:hypothetical protein
MKILKLNVKFIRKNKIIMRMTINKKVQKALHTYHVEIYGNSKEVIIETGFGNFVGLVDFYKRKIILKDKVIIPAALHLNIATPLKFIKIPKEYMRQLF